MPSRIKRLIDQQKFPTGSIPHWLEANHHLEVIMGSRAYGCHSEDSDYDLRGIFTCPKVMYFPATEGLITGFDDIPSCEHWNPSEEYKDEQGCRYDIDIHSIAKFLRLATENNPNQIDLLFAPEDCITHCSTIGRMIIDSRQMFLSKLCWRRYRGYAADQMKHVQNRKPRGKRAAIVEEFGWDVRFGSQVFRLLTQAEQILFEGHLDLTKNNQELKAIRRGEWTLERLNSEFLARKLAIEQNFHKCQLPEKPDKDKVRQLLLDCLEHHYGSLSKAVVRPDETVRALRDMDVIMSRVRPLL